jgi:hypothetical protein
MKTKQILLSAFIAIVLGLIMIAVATTLSSCEDDFNYGDEKPGPYIECSYPWIKTTIDSLDNNHWILISDWRNGAWTNNISNPAVELHFVNNLKNYGNFIVFSNYYSQSSGKTEKDKAEYIDANLVYTLSNTEKIYKFEVKRYAKDTLVILQQFRSPRIIRTEPYYQYGNGAQRYVRKK